RLFDASGAPIAGTAAITFAVYAQPAGGAALWSETQAVPLEDGYFSAALGSATPLPPSVLDGSVRYVGITVGSDPELSPRQATASVPYALLARDAVGDLHPTSVSVNGAEVIDGNGQWVGSPT